ncbi:ABC transporter permease [Fodinicurvata halophila]|uniref:ABC transporter permease n=1 Tax=Fodinicurvata halophila TaxID=1419723 RepID=A0ABV8UG51_9PROT
MIQAFRRSERVLSILLVLVGAIAVWEVCVWIFQPRIFILPPPSIILVNFLEAPGYFIENTGYTLLVTVTGFVVAVLAGVLCAIGIVYSKFLDRTLYTLLVALNSVPKVALAPLFVLWMGTGSEPKIAIAIAIAIFPIVIDAVLGLRSVDPDMINLAKASRASNTDILMKIRFPNALPSIFAGMKVAISFALIGAIVGEFVAGEAGLGHVILQSQGMFNTPRVFVALVILGIVGTILFYLVDLMERLLLPWHVSQRGEKKAAPQPGA